MKSQQADEPGIPRAPRHPARLPVPGAGMARAGGSAVLPPPGANFQKMRRPRPRPSRRCWRRQEAGAEPASPGRWLRLLLRPPPPPYRLPPQLPPARSTVQQRCPAARPRPGSPAHRVISPGEPRARRRQRRALKQRWATPCTGPCQVRPGALPRRRALGCSSPWGTRWVTSGEPPSPWSPQRPAGWSLQCLPDPRSACAARLGFALQEGGYRVLVTLGTPVLVLSALARCEKGPLGAMPCAPSPLFQPEGADEEAWGAPGDHWSRAPQSFGRPEPPVGWRLQLLRGGTLRGTPVSSRPAPPRHKLLWFGHVPTRTPAAPPSGVRSTRDSSPSESPLQSASPPS